MSSISVRDAAPAAEPCRPRVREQARDAAVLMAFSFVAASSLAAGLLLLAHLGR